MNQVARLGAAGIRSEGLLRDCDSGTRFQYQYSQAIRTHIGPIWETPTPSKRNGTPAGASMYHYNRPCRSSCCRQSPPSGLARDAMSFPLRPWHRTAQAELALSGTEGGSLWYHGQHGKQQGVGTMPRRRILCQGSNRSPPMPVETAWKALATGQAGEPTF